MSNEVQKLFLRPYGMVIPATAVGPILFNTWKEVIYSVDRSERVVNPMVMTYEATFASATIFITDETIAGLIRKANPSDEDEDEDEEDEEDEAPKKKKRGRPSAKKVVEEEAFEPLEVEVVFFTTSDLVASVPLNESEPIQSVIRISEKNERNIRKRMSNLSGNFNLLESIRGNLEKAVEKANEHLNSVVSDMTGESGVATNNLTQSAVEEYRNRERRKEAGIISDIDEGLDKFQEIIARANYRSEVVPLTENVSDNKEASLRSIVTMFFTNELYKI